MNEQRTASSESSSPDTSLAASSPPNAPAPSVAVVGCGYWGKNLVRNFAALGALQAVCDADVDRLRTFRDQYPQVRATPSFPEILSDTSIPAVVLATPAAMHYRQAREALEAGKDVFVEKPLALTVEEGGALVDLAEKTRRILMVGHLLQYHPGILKLKKLVDKGALGKIQYVYSNRLNLGKIRTEENILWSFAPHDISAILLLLGERPSETQAHGASYLHPDRADVTVTTLRFPSGVTGHIFVSWLHPYKEQKLVIVGDRGMAVFDDVAKERKLTIYNHSVEWVGRVPVPRRDDGQDVPFSPEEPLRAECAHFLQCVATRQRPRTDGEEGLAVLEILAACQRALDGKPAATSVQPPSPPKRAYFAHETAVVDEPCEIGEGTKIWHFSHVMKGAKIGERCILGQNVNVDGGVVVGNNVKIQNNVSLYTGVVIEDDVFLGPSCVLTNVTNPRSQVNRHSLYEKTTLRRGCTIGANATIVCGVTIGRYAFVAAGAVATKDVPDYALVLGNPARQHGWMSRHGHRLGAPDADGIMRCPESGYRYRETAPGAVKCLDLDEDSPLPESLRKGTRPYREFKDAGHSA
jgi:UDP-2-acetamido-3-amino-2,3-dideoxy-glucuronate N-acetyltransferase